MIDAIKFVMPAVGSANILTGLDHFKINGGRITAYNGTIALSTEIPIDINCIVNADKFQKAISNSKFVTQINKPDDSKIVVKSGPLKINISCIDTDVDYFPSPSGSYHKQNSDNGFLKTVKLLYPFINKSDIGRPFSKTLMFTNGMVYVTNNIIAIAHKHIFDQNVPDFNLSRSVIKELIRIGQEPCAIQFDTNTITFHYQNGAWFKGPTMDIECPNIMKLIESVMSAVGTECSLIDETLWSGLEHIKPFVDKACSVRIEAGLVRTHDSIDEGASYTISDDSLYGVYNIDSLISLKSVAKYGNIRRWPDHAFFKDGDGQLIGICAGLKL